MPSDGLGFGVRVARLLLVDSGRALGVFCRFWVVDSVEDDGCFLTVDTERETEFALMGVTVDVVTLALALRLPGAVIDSLLDGPPSLLGVAGATCGAPSLVEGLLPLDVTEAGRSGGGMLLSALKKLDLRLPFFDPGDDGSCDRLSMVLSESDCLLFFLAMCLDTVSSLTA